MEQHSKQSERTKVNNKNFKKQIHKMLIKILENEDQYLVFISVI